jgi:hypothetical protein
MLMEKSLLLTQIKLQSDTDGQAGDQCTRLESADDKIADLCATKLSFSDLSARSHLDSAICKNLQAATVPAHLL